MDIRLPDNASLMANGNPQISEQAPINESIRQYFLEYDTLWLTINPLLIHFVIFIYNYKASKFYTLFYRRSSLDEIIKSYAILEAVMNLEIMGTSRWALRLYTAVYQEQNKMWNYVSNETIN